MFKNPSEYPQGDFGYCEVCDNFTPQDDCPDCEEQVCVVCHLAYGCDN